MPRVSAAVIENNFVGGLKTEYTGLNFPENSASETSNCVFSKIGRVTRRKGIDLEDVGVYETLDRTNSVVNSYVWHNVSGDGTIDVLVLQIGSTLRFYKASNITTALSDQLLATTVNLNSYIPIGSTVSPAAYDCQFAQGNGYLFVFHPYLDPIYVSYNTVDDTVTSNSITVSIRDQGGINENLPDTQRPTTLTSSHRYNLGNQGWRSGYSLTSATSNTIGTGSKTFTTGQDASTTPILTGDPVKIYSSATHTNQMIGVVTSFTGTTLTVNVTSVGGSGTLTDWNIVTYPDDILTWNEQRANFPSNADVWWNFKNSSDVFDPSTYANVPSINAPAPKGHYIVEAFNINRSNISGVSGLTTVTTGGIRPSTGAFFQGRVFYSGVNYSAYNSDIYFSQIIEKEEQFGRCYQMNDPTSEDLFDLGPSDGGTVSIQGAGTILKLVALRNALIVFATNGVWAITGNQGSGFTANDYTIAPISNVRALSATSFVQIQENIAWWNTEGIYNLSITDKGLQINSITVGTIASFYENIPNECKLNARGIYNPVSFIVQWIYRSEIPESIEEKYEFDSVLNFNTVTNAFYPWTISESSIKVNGIFVAYISGGSVQTNNVVRSSDNVIDGSGNQVVTYTFTQEINPLFKYVISKPNGSSYSVSFGEEYRETYLDWQSEGTGISYDSYFIVGYGVHGDAQRFFESNYVYVYSEANDENLNTTSYTIQGLWDYATSGASGQFTSVQRANIVHDNYSVIKKRFKIRGRGVSLQLKFGSTESLPFSIIGWSKWETANRGI